MDRAAAEIRLRAMVAAGNQPTLDDAEIFELLDIAEGRDWDLRHAAAQGWRWKAGKAIDEYAFAEPDSRADRQQLHDMCMRMADGYGSRRVGTVRTPSAATEAASDALTGVG